jgi:ABC-type lipoprotein export system ATPase subunit
VSDTPASDVSAADGAALPASRPTPILEASALSKSYRRGPENVRALDDASLSVYAGEIVALVGPSGSGKTTLLSVLAGWEHADGGEVCWSGRPIADPRTLGWGDMAIVPQTLGLVEELSVRENVELPLLLGRRSGGGGAGVESLLDALGLTRLAERLPAEISLGEQQRTALARALVLSPSVLMADEPTGHQDVDWTRGVLRVLEAAAADGIACLIATHHLALVRYAHRVLRIEDGRIDLVAADEVVAAGDEL